MQIRFQKSPWDLYISVGYTILAATTMLILGSGTVLSALILLLFPGYLLVAAIFPADQRIMWTERLALSIALSLAVGPPLGLFLHATPFGIRFETIVAIITIFCCLTGFAAYKRRMRLPIHERLSATLRIGPYELNAYSITERIFVITLGIMMVITVVTFGYIALKARPADRFTEFYILGPEGNASDYPTRLNVSQPGTVLIRTQNHELRDVDYTVRIDLVGIRVVFNTSANRNETLELNRTTLSWFNGSLADGQNRTQPFTFRIDSPDSWIVHFILFKDGDLSFPYRDLQLYVRVG